ncbi:sensor histidine kinase [Aquirufa nivalisilvae]|uniref:sensor histidine kinase n=1 Tax=Aquirufa nivalisilvae TaxID=2516557 RepID=UPI0010329157|nr:sensor histidine kinase [Aquirufa nivalisilvae]TBH72314.1 sensor histidine kinase [Aquirufa nivalisilvae]
MAIIKSNSEPFRPYARLMNIIGDQLITDKKVAVIEVVKNCYDADAENVQVRFFNLNNYGKTYLTEKEQPYIEIEDDGDGMTLKTITDIWLRPATPNKLDKKKNKLNKTKRGRIIQGEKGIGRFAIHKLGEKIELYTKSEGNNEIKLEMDFTEFNPEKADLFNQGPSDYKLLEDVNNKWFVNEPPIEIVKEKGTLVRIYNLREKWNNSDLNELYKSIQRLLPPIDENAENLEIAFKQDFVVTTYLDEKDFTPTDITTFSDIIERAQYTMFGSVSSDGILEFTYRSTAPKRELKRRVNLLNKESLNQFQYPTKTIEEWFIENDRTPTCGGFKFSFYAFNLKNRDKTVLTKEIELFIKKNFIYLFRDGVRVYPFGEPGYDWLELDKLRARVRAGDYISYNDLTGFVYIGQGEKENPLLKDSTNRQGMMNIDGAYEDFKTLVTAVTQVLNLEKKIDENRLNVIKERSFKDSNEIVLNSFNTFKSSLEKIDNREVLEKANKFLDTVQKHNVLMNERMITVEDLAGLGMAVEKASHDALTLLSKMRGNVKDFRVKAKNLDYNNEELISFLIELDENLNFVYDEMQVIQPLFKNQRKAIQDISVYECVEKVLKYFRREIDGKINIRIIKDNDIIVKTNKGLILQVLINLIDNAVYWVSKNETRSKEITIKLNSANKSFVVADNGPGIREEIIPMIFNEFFSLKSDGRGLGLYIVREILLRIDGEINVVKEGMDKLLTGANFIIKFNQEQ